MPHLEGVRRRVRETLVKLRCSCVSRCPRQQGAGSVQARVSKRKVWVSSFGEDRRLCSLPLGTQWQNNAGGQSNLLSVSPRFFVSLIPLSRMTRRPRLTWASSIISTSNPRLSLGAMQSPTPSRAGAVFSPTSCSSTRCSCRGVYGSLLPCILRQTSPLSQTSYTRSRTQITTG